MTGIYYEAEQISKTGYGALCIKLTEFGDMVDESMYNSVAKPQKEQKEAALVDPCDIQSKIKSLQDEIELLETEVDFILSEYNAKTVISVDLTSWHDFIWIYLNKTNKTNRLFFDAEN